MLESFKDEDGHFFFSSSGQIDIDSRSEQVMRGMLNLLRASSVAFPGETVMEEAKIFTSACLNTLLQTSREAYNASFLKEVINRKLLSFFSHILVLIHFHLTLHSSFFILAGRVRPCI